MRPWLVSIVLTPAPGPSVTTDQFLSARPRRNHPHAFTLVCAMAINGEAITCDKCGKTITIPSPHGTATAKALRETAQNQGWTAWEGRDLCKACWPG